jgi:hypothetical protein
MKSDKTSLIESTPETEPPFPYLNPYHKEHSEALMAERSEMPSVSAKEAYAQYDRLKEQAQRSSKPSTKKSTLLRSVTT